MNTLKILVLLAIICLSLTADKKVDWTKASQWGGSCQDGERQSPIDFNSKQVVFCPIDHWIHLQAPCQDFEYMEQGQSLTSPAQFLTFLTYAHVDWEASTTYISIYNSLQVHYHTPSQHTINGQSYDLEMHLVHTYWNMTPYFVPNKTEQMEIKANQNSSLYAVIGVLFKIDYEIEEDGFDTFLPDPQETNQTNLVKAFECVKDRFFYHYKGSLTTPVCAEEVEWFVVRDPLPIRPENYQRFKRLLNDGKPNSRPVQDLHDRKVYLLNQEVCTRYLSDLEFLERNMGHMKMDKNGFPEMDDDSDDV